MTQRPPIQHVLVLVPTYNERENLPRILQRLRDSVPDADILVLDDNSPDGTGQLADDLAAADDHIKVLHRAGKEGLGKAYLAGFAWGTEHGYDAMVEIDADGSHPPERLPAMIEAAANADLVIGSRWMKGGSVVNWPKRREVLSRGANLYVRGALGTRVHDATAGYRVYRTSTLETIDVQSVSSQGYGFQIDLTWRVLQAGLTIVELPIRFVEREIGVSKMTGNIISEAFVSVARWGGEHRVQQLRGVASKVRGRG